MIPKEMRGAKRWFPVNVRKNKTTGKWDKKPAVEWSNCGNWKTFDELPTEQAKGFALGDGFFGIDLDDCLEPQTAQIKPERSELVNAVLNLCPSFTEVSWSGKGLHVYGYGKMPQACKDATPGLEMYSDKRFFLFTSRPFDAGDIKPLANIQSGIEELYRRYGRKSESKNGTAKPKNTTVGEGHRSNTVFSKASTLYKLGFSHDAVVAAMLVWNREHCNPPKTDEEVRKQCEDRYPSERFPLPENEELRAEILTYVLRCAPNDSNRCIIAGSKTKKGD